MPCGGIYPITPDHDFGKMHGTSLNDNCFYCGKGIEPVDLMFCDEWDCYLHRHCVILFLETEEGQVVVNHGHQVVLYWENQENQNANNTGSDGDIRQADETSQDKE